MFNLLGQQATCDLLKSAVLKTIDPIERNRQFEAIRQLECVTWQPNILAQVMEEVGPFTLGNRVWFAGETAAIPLIVSRYLELVNVTPVVG